MWIEIPESEVAGSLAEEEEGTAVLGDVADAAAGVDLPLAEDAQVSLNHHTSKYNIN